MQRVGNVLIGGDDRALILSRGLLKRLLGSTLSVQQRATLEYGLGDVADQIPERTARAEHPAELVRVAAIRAGDRELREHCGHSDADLRIRGMELRLGRPNVGALFDDLGRQGERQLRRQYERIEFE